MIQYTYGEWLDEAKKRFGMDATKWKFVCVACGHVQSMSSVMDTDPDQSVDSVQEWINFSCEGRFNKGHGCNWTLGGLMQLHPVEVAKDGEEKPVRCFEFYPATQDPLLPAKSQQTN